MNKLLLITDSFDSCADPEVLTYTWTGYSERDKQKSILNFIETSADNFKAQYLNFIASLSNAQFSNEILSEYFVVNDGPSLWWMSLLAEKSTYKSSRITDCIRLMALEKIILIHKPKRLMFCIDDRILADSIQILCNGLAIDFIWQHKSNRLKLNFFRSDRFLHFYSKFTAAIYLVYYFVTRWPLRDSRIRSGSRGTDTVFFASYLYNLDLALAEEGIYHSRQWGLLPEFINQSGHKTFHLEHFVKSPAIQKPKLAKRIMSFFDSNYFDQSHISFDGLLSFQVLRNIIFDYLKLRKKILNIKNVRELFRVPNSELNLWPVLKNDWFCSFLGKTSVSNLIVIELFSRHMQRLSFQKIGFYLCENIAWERALIKAWKDNNHGILIAVPHSTIRFWDLRYFSSPEHNAHPSEIGLPLPDKYAVNGQMARNALIQNGYPANVIEDVEALRYQFLENYLNVSSNIDEGSMKYKKAKTRILVVGDSTKHQTDLMLRALEILVDKFDFLADYTLKPHPVCDIDMKEYPLLKGNQTNESLQSIVGNFDFVFGSNDTTASLDCFLMRSKVIVFLDENDLNFSPLRGVSGISFVSNPQELYEAMIKSAEDPEIRTVQHDFFWIDSTMPKWKKLVNELTS